jgi:hypothetical protein
MMGKIFRSLRMEAGWRQEGQVLLVGGVMTLENNGEDEKVLCEY